MEVGNINSPLTRTYADRATLVKKLALFNLAGFRYVVVCTEMGRFTAIFISSSLGGAIGQVAHMGFLVVG